MDDVIKGSRSRGENRQPLSSSAENRRFRSKVLSDRVNIVFYKSEELHEKDLINVNGCAFFVSFVWWLREQLGIGWFGCTLQA